MQSLCCLGRDVRKANGLLGDHAKQEYPNAVRYATCICVNMGGTYSIALGCHMCDASQVEKK